MPESDALVQFVISGMQKAGTTALQHYLKSHPGLCMSERKELHFFDNETSVDWQAPNYREYEGHFDHKGEGQICGEATPIYSFWPNSLERLQAYNPVMKHIIMLRDRCERAYSHWTMEVSRGSDDVSFSEAIRGARDRYDSENASAPINRVVSYVERGFYAPQLERVSALFGKENVLVIQNTTLQNQPNAALKSICEFLNVENFPNKVEPVFIRPVKPQEGLDPMTETDRNFLTEIYASDVERVEQLALRSI